MVKISRYTARSKSLEIRVGNLVYWFKLFERIWLSRNRSVDGAPPGFTCQGAKIVVLDVQSGAWVEIFEIWVTNYTQESPPFSTSKTYRTFRYRRKSDRFHSKSIARTKKKQNLVNIIVKLDFIDLFCRSWRTVFLFRDPLSGPYFRKQINKPER